MRKNARCVGLEPLSKCTTLVVHQLWFATVLLEADFDSDCRNIALESSSSLIIRAVTVHRSRDSLLPQFRKRLANQHLGCRFGFKL